MKKAKPCNEIGEKVQYQINYRLNDDPIYQRLDEIETDLNKRLTKFFQDEKKKTARFRKDVREHNKQVEKFLSLIEKALSGKAVRSASD